MSHISLKAKLDEKGINVDALEFGMVEAFKMAVGGLAKAAQNEWVARAQEKLGTSRDIYIEGLRAAESFKHTRTASGDLFEVQLVGTMPNNFEFGMASFDMKSVRPGWLGGGKALTAKDGHKYIRIPFRHSTSNSRRLDYTGKAKAADLKTELRRTVKAYGLDRMVRAAGGGVAEGPVARVPKGAAVHPYLKGLTRVQKAVAGGRKAQGQLMTWRVMSEKSPASAWIHPGVKAAGLLGEVENWVERQLDSIIERILGD